MCWVSSPLTQAWTCPYHSPQLSQSSVNAVSLLPMTYPGAQTYSSSSPISKPVWPCRMVWGKDGGSPQGLSERRKGMIFVKTSQQSFNAVLTGVLRVSLRINLCTSTEIVHRMCFMPLCPFTIISSCNCEGINWAITVVR